MTTSCDIPQVCHSHIIDMIRNGAVSWHNEQMLNSWDVVTEVNSHHMMSATSCRSDHMHSMASAYSLKWIRWKIITGYPSNSKSCSSYVCWCIKCTQDEHHHIMQLHHRISRHHFTSSSALHQQSTLGNAAHASEVWRTLVFVCQTITAWTHSH